MAPRSDWENPTSCLVTSPHSAHTIQSPCSFPRTVLCVLLSLFFHECVCVCLCVFVCVCICLCLCLCVHVYVVCVCVCMLVVALLQPPPHPSPLTHPQIPNW